MRSVVLVVAFCVQSFGQDQISGLVEMAIKDEIAEFAQVKDRFEKGKLKPGESVTLFGQKKLTKAQQRERMAEIGAQVEAGEVSFRAIDPVKFGELKLGRSGCFVGRQQAIRVRRVVGSDEFLGSYQELVVGLRSREWQWENDPKRWLHFKAVEGANEVIEDQELLVSQPWIISGRYQFASPRGELITTWSIEPLSVALKRVRKKMK